MSQELYVAYRVIPLALSPGSRLPLALLIQRGSFYEVVISALSAFLKAGRLVMNIPSTIFHGFLFSVTFARRVALSFMRSWQNRIAKKSSKVKCLVGRIRATLQGSVDDIGWLQRMPNLPPIENRTERFVQLLGLISNGIHKLPNNFVYLLIPGLFSNHSPLYFVEIKKYFSKLGLTCHIAKIHSEASVETNACELKNYIEELYWGCGKRVMLLGHSKGGVDAAAAVSKYWSELKEKVAGLVVVQSPYGGSPIASDILREGQIADVETRRVMELLICKVIKGDIRSLEDLTYAKRQEFLAIHPLPSGFPTVSFHTEASIAPGVLATMSHIAHAELPWLPLPGFQGLHLVEPLTATKLPVILPVAAVMAITALHLELRYGVKSDGLVARNDAEIPGSIVVRPDQKLHHAWMVYSRSHKTVQESEAAQMCEALLTLLLEAQVAAATSNYVEGERKV